MEDDMEDAEEEKEEELAACDWDTMASSPRHDASTSNASTAAWKGGTWLLPLPPLLLLLLLLATLVEETSLAPSTRATAPSRTDRQCSRTCWLAPSPARACAWMTRMHSRSISATRPAHRPAGLSASAAVHRFDSRGVEGAVESE